MKRWAEDHLYWFIFILVTAVCTFFGALEYIFYTAASLYMPVWGIFAWTGIGAIIAGVIIGLDRLLR